MPKTPTTGGDTAAATAATTSDVDASTEAAPGPTADDMLDAVAVDFPDGRVTFTRPGIESETFTVKDGKISTTRARRDWLLRHVVGVVPAADSTTS